MEKGVVYASNEMRHMYMQELSVDVREAVLDAVRESLTRDGLEGAALEWGLEAASDSRLCDLEDAISMEYLDSKPLQFYVVNNLRFQQDKTPFEVCRFLTLDMAYECYSQVCDKYTSALGVTVASGREIDIVHARGGESVLVTDYRRIEGFKDNPLVLQAIDNAIGKLGIQREGNYDLFKQWVEIPLDKGEAVNSYIDNKRLLPEDPKHPISAINEAFCDGRGWVKAEDLFKELADYDPYVNPIHVKISSVNANYVRTDTKETGQMDISPSALAVMLERYKEMEKKPPLDVTIKQASAKKQREERPAQSKDNEYYKTSDGWFDFYVNAKTGEKKFKLDKSDVCVERKSDDFHR